MSEQDIVKNTLKIVGEHLERQKNTSSHISEQPLNILIVC